LKDLQKTKKPWPTNKVMEQIYEMKLWGNNNSNFYSGEGSHHPKIIEPYITVVSTFLKSFKQPLVICDLGCGDFNVGKHFIIHVKKYIAIDIVSSLIEFNSKIYKNDNLEFHCLDISKDNLPQADCVIIRQVLQHLSNNEVANILDKLSHYKYIIVTEHIPNGDFIPNKDIIAGQGIRLKKKSGLQIVKAPFYFNVGKEKIMLTQDLEADKGKIITTLYTNLSID
jgi:2-polyprenyl-3-methyl-5-hydroxy-6-metoxy-1,4-benzoquinol methylase